ncbi:MAG: hypothetical protein ACLSHL_06185 [Alistipes communis]
MLAFGFGVLNTVALCLFLYSGDSMFVNLLSMVLFGMAIGVLICFWAGWMAIDIVPREPRARPRDRRNGQLCRRRVAATSSAAG